MIERYYRFKISPEVIKNKIFEVKYDSETLTPIVVDECCEITTTTTTSKTVETVYVYSSMTEILSGGTNGTSLLTGMTIPILLTEDCVDMGYYSVFDGLVTQKDVMCNFIFSAQTGIFNNVYYLYNTSDVEFKKYLNFSSYMLDWGDGDTQLITEYSPQFYTHTYSLPPSGTQVKYTITMSGMSPWGWNVVKKDVYVPFTGTTIENPNGETFFYPLGGNWSGTPISYDYIFSGDSVCDVENESIFEFTTIPYIISGYTQSTINDLQVYGNPQTLLGGKFKVGVPVTGDSGTVGVVLGSSSDGLYTAYTINGITYYDYIDGTTIFLVETSGLTSEQLICSAITKNEVLMNVVDEPQVESNVYVERGKNSGLESLQRLGEVDNIGDLTLYGYKFFKIVKT